MQLSCNNIVAFLRALRGFAWRALRFKVLLLAFALPAPAQERPYFVTYSHEMEEPGNLEIESVNVAGQPPGGNLFLGSNLEFEYGVKAWWTSEFYLDGQSTQNDSTIFTGFRWENRFRPLLSEHVINPALYVEYENISADRALREIVGHDGLPDFADPNGAARKDVEREMELKLILGSNFRGWNVSENFVAEKSFAANPWEFGYAWAASRPLALAARAQACTFCPEKFEAGLEMYGGLGDRSSFGLHNTSHYAGPTINWTAPNGTNLSFSPQFGLNDYSVPHLYRFAISYEIPQFLGLFHRWAK
jgi:hypothetical protein